MNNLRELSAAVALTFALVLPAVAGQLDTPPCAAPGPGQVETPPCITAAAGDMGTAASTAAGNMGTAAVTDETLLTRIAADVLLNFLPLF